MPSKNNPHPRLTGADMKTMLRENIDGIVEIEWANGNESEPMGYWILATEQDRFRITFPDDPEKDEAWWENFDACSAARLILTPKQHMELLLNL